MLSDLLFPIQKDLEKVNELIDRECQSVHSGLLRDLLAHVFAVRGKMLRPALVLCSSNLHHSRLEEKSILVATGIEILHTASLIHDDIIDHGVLRRGQQTVNQRWGIAEATLLGDWLLAKAFELITRSGNLQIIQEMPLLTSELTEGQFLEMELAQSGQSSEADYLRMIDLKTASVFRYACSFGVHLSTGGDQAAGNLREFGTHFGVLFQILDDLIDILSLTVEAGKSTSMDLLNGMKTLPILRGLKLEKRFPDPLLSRAIQDQDPKFFRNSLPNYLEELGVVEECKTLARDHASKASSFLLKAPASKYRDILSQLQTFTLGQV
jgi:octaprenyl-diphosphate synthase